MTPAHWHISLQESVSAGLFPTSTVGQPGAHGAEVIGIHGMGVSTPSAAAVAAATCGFDILLHIPNGITFTPGLLSMMFAAGFEQPITLFSGRTFSVDGAAPKVQLHIAPAVTKSDIALPHLLSAAGVGAITVSD